MLHSSLSAAPEAFVAAAVEVGVDVEEAEGEVDDGEVADEAELDDPWPMAAARNVSMLSFGPGLIIMTIPKAQCGVQCT